MHWFDWAFHDPGQIAFNLVSILAPLLGWFIALYITRSHFKARAHVRRSLQWFVLAYYGALFAIILIETTWPLGWFSPLYTFRSLAYSTVLVGGLYLAYLFVRRAQKIAQSDFAGFCPQCAYSRGNTSAARCPECGHSFASTSDRAT